MNRTARLLLAASLAAPWVSEPADAATLSGTLTMTINVTLRVPGKGYTMVNCSAHAYLVPPTGATVNLSATLPFSWMSRAATQSSNAVASHAYKTTGSTIAGTPPTPTSAGTVTAAKCVVTVPYTFSNPNASLQNIAVVYSATVTDPGAIVSGALVFPGHPGGKTKQVVQIAAPPAGGAIAATANITL